MNKEYYQELVERKKSGVITADEATELQEFILHNPSLNSWWQEEYNLSSSEVAPALSRKLFEQIKKNIADVDREDGGNRLKVDQGKPVIETKTTETSVLQSKIIKKYTLKTLQWVAAVIIPIALIFSLQQWIDNPKESSVPLIVSAQKGHRATIELPDGTIAQLNSASKLYYTHPIHKGERKATLMGEAYFQVAHDDSKPFVIQVGELNIRVLGTSFSVKSYEELEEVSVVLLEGKVEISSAHATCTLAPGERLCYNKSTQTMMTEQVDASDYLVWTKGELYFDNESMVNLMQTISRMYDVEIQISSESLRMQRFTGTIPTGSIEKTLRILMLTASFTYAWENGDIVLTEQ